MEISCINSPLAGRGPALSQPRGALTPQSIGAILGNLLPEQAIVTDESVTTGRSFFKDTHGAAPHDWLSLPGGAIGATSRPAQLLGVGRVLKTLWSSTGSYPP